MAIPVAWTAAHKADGHPVRHAGRSKELDALWRGARGKDRVDHLGRHLRAGFRRRGKRASRSAQLHDHDDRLVYVMLAGPRLRVMPVRQDTNLHARLLNCKHSYSLCKKHRAADLGDFSPPIFQFDHTLLVPGNSAIQQVADADRSGIKIAAVRNDASTMELSRLLRQAELAFADTRIAHSSFAPRTSQRHGIGASDPSGFAHRRVADCSIALG
jgi:hypothetical protein